MYKVISDRPELKRGARFTVAGRPLEAGKLYLFKIGPLLILGRWFPGWIIQPGRWIDTIETEVETLGRIVKIE